MLRKNRNILESIIPIILQKLFGKKLSQISVSEQIFERDRTNKSKIAYNKQQNIYITLLRKTNFGI